MQPHDQIARPPANHASGSQVSGPPLRLGRERRMIALSVGGIPETDYDETSAPAR